MKITLINGNLNVSDEATILFIRLRRTPRVYPWGSIEGAQEVACSGFAAAIIRAL